MKANAIQLSPDLDREGVIRALLPIVRKNVARLSRGPYAKVRDDDLMSAGMVGLFEATARFDPKRLDSFIGYANLRIRGAMLDELRKADDLTQDMRSRSRTLETAVAKLAHELGRPPEAEEIAERLGLNDEAYTAFMESVSTQKAVLLPPDSPELCDVAVNDSDPEERAERNQLKAQLVDALKWLPLKEQQVMAMHYDHDMSFREIGETMGLTAARACQLHTLAVHRIRASLGERSEVGNV